MNSPYSPDPSAAPFRRSYWAAPGKLLGGCDPGDADSARAQQKLLGLVRCGVGLMINLMQADEVNYFGQPFVDYRPALGELARRALRNVRCERFPIGYNQVPTVAHMQRILDEIDAANAAGEIVYVHCWGGKGRTGMVIGCWLARRGLAVGDAALKRLNELTKTSRYDFGYVPQTPAQCDFVRNWGKGE